MGEAKRRGTFQQRKEEAIVRDVKSIEERRVQREVYEESPEYKKIKFKMSKLLIPVLVIGGMSKLAGERSEQNKTGQST